jgi:hypothetical protein
VDGNDPSGFASLFSDGDGVCEVVKARQRVQGREALRALCTSMYNAFPNSQRSEGNAVVHGVDKKAQSISNWNVVRNGQGIVHGR